MRKWLKRSLVTLVFLVALIQFVRPARTNPVVDPRDHLQAVLPVEREVSAAFSRACNDCHSNSTKWPWYSNVAPVSWLVTNDVTEGRRELNFSAWRTYTGEKQQKLLGKICKEVSEGEMPMATYIFAHPNAKLTEAERQAVCSWTRMAAVNLPGAREAGEQAEAEEEAE